MIHFFLLGNKSDLTDRREVTVETAEKFASDFGLMYIETSAVATVNITEAFVSLVKSSPGWKGGSGSGGGKEATAAESSSSSSQAVNVK